MADETTKTTASLSTNPKTGGKGFPDPTITLIEFGEALGVLLAARTERDPGARRLVLKKVAYVRLEPKGWGGAAYAEVWIEQTPDGIYRAIEAHSGRVFRDPSRRRYEVAFLSKEIFDCAIQCLKERNPEAIYELLVVSFGSRPDFGLDAGGLLGPEDYAAARDVIADDNLLPTPPRTEAKAG